MTDGSTELFENIFYKVVIARLLSYDRVTQKSDTNQSINYSLYSEKIRV